MKRTSVFFATLALQLASASAQDVITDLRTYPGYGEPGSELSERMNSPACQRYLTVTHNGADNNPFQTDQIQVYKNGFLVDEYYKPGVYSADTFHVMMSASKPVTATILDAAIQMGLRHNGNKISYDTKLADFYSYNERQRMIAEKKPAKPLKLPDQDRQWYEQITLRDLVRMQSGFKWNESYDNPLGDFMSALYVDGIEDIVRASLVVPMEREPGTKFNYSGGNANIIQGIIRLLGRENFDIDDANQIAKILLFSRLGIMDAFFERDMKDSAIGSTYLYLKPEGMARLGHLYLNKGFWRDSGGATVRILSEEFIAGLSTVNSAVDRAEIDETYLEYIKEEGVPSNSITWLNKDVVDKSDVVRYSQEFPNAPDDMFALAGHNGQIIYVLPSQKIVIAITGNNRGYWNKMNKIAATTASCFSGLSLAPDLRPHTLPLPDENEDQRSFPKKSKDTIVSAFKTAPPAVKLLVSAIASGVVAKELCSCMRVVLKTDDVKRAIEHCPGDVPQLLQRNYTVKYREGQGVDVRSLLNLYRREALFADEYGCRLTPYKN